MVALKCYLSYSTEILSEFKTWIRPVIELRRSGLCTTNKSEKLYIYKISRNNQSVLMATIVLFSAASQY